MMHSAPHTDRSRLSSAFPVRCLQWQGPLWKKRLPPSQGCSPEHRGLLPLCSAAPRWTIPLMWRHMSSPMALQTRSSPSAWWRMYFLRLRASVLGRRLKISSARSATFRKWRRPAIFLPDTGIRLFCQAPSQFVTASLAVSVQSPPSLISRFLTAASNPSVP